MRVKIEYNDVDYDGKIEVEVKKEYVVRDYWQPFIMKILDGLAKEEWVGK